MGQDNGMDNPLPISKEGLLAALDVAIEQAKSMREWIINADEMDGHIEYLERLHENIKEDKATYYPPVARKG